MSILRDDVLTPDQLHRLGDYLMGRVHPPLSFDPNRLRPGVRVRVEYEAVVSDEGPDPLAGTDGDQYVALRRPDGDEKSLHFYEDLNFVKVQILPPDVVPGVILTAGGATWVVRKSNPRDSLRAMPVDLSGKLRTLPIEDFASRYPSAKVVFDPRKTYLEVTGA